MEKSLFRQEAVAHQAYRLPGEVLVIPRLSHSLFTVTIIVIAVLTALWLTQGKFARKQTANGWVEPFPGWVKVFPQSAVGRIKTILVAEGDPVEQGQPLAIVNGDTILTSGKTLEGELIGQYNTQRAVVTSQLSRIDDDFRYRRLDINQQLDTANHEKQLIEMQLTVLQRRFALMEEKHGKFKAIEALGHIASEELNQVKDKLLSIKTDVQVLKQRKVAHLSKIEQLVNQLTLLANEQKERRDELALSLSKIDQSITQLMGQRAHIIRAPVSGVVSNLTSRVGSRVTQESPIMTLVPENSDLIAKLLVPVRAAGFIQSGQRFKVRYDAFPYQKFGMYRGEIVQVSKTVILPRELVDYPVISDEPVYLVRAKLDKPHVLAFNEPIPLKPGMTLSSDIQLKERSVLEWFLEPIYSLKGRI